MNVDNKELFYTEFYNFQDAQKFAKLNDNLYMFCETDCPEEGKIAYKSYDDFINNVGYIVANRDLLGDAVTQGLIPEKDYGVWAEFENGSELDHVYNKIEHVRKDELLEIAKSQLSHSKEKIIYNSHIRSIPKTNAKPKSHFYNDKGEEVDISLPENLKSYLVDAIHSNVSNYSKEDLESVSLQTLAYTWDTNDFSELDKELSKINKQKAHEPKGLEIKQQAKSQPNPGKDER